MGTTAFQNRVPISEEPDFSLAFSSAHQSAQADSGGDYSGTICEKGGVLAFPSGCMDLQQDGLNVTTIIGTLEASDVEAQATFLRVWPRLARALERAQDLYNDKWAPAVGFRFGDAWYFVGFASS